MEYNYNLNYINEDLTIKGAEVVVLYQVNASSGAITFMSNHNNKSYKRVYIDTFDNYYDEALLLSDLAKDFIKYIEKEDEK